MVVLVQNLTLFELIKNEIFSNKRDRDLTSSSMLVLAM